MIKSIKSVMTIMIFTAVCLLTACNSQASTNSSYNESQNPISTASAAVPNAEQYPDTSTKTKLVIATVADSSSLRASVSRFNSYSDEYYVEIVDYSNSGATDPDDAVRVLNTELIAGKIPDMICFSSFSPYAYISKGYIADLYDFIEEDNDISLDDIAISNALEKNGAIYYLGSIFSFETLIGLHSEFGERYGWTLDEYLDIESTTPAEVPTIYNMTKESFARYISSRYIREGIDWINGTCSFDSDEFIEILEASNRIKEIPETVDTILYGYGGTLVGNGSLVTAVTTVDFIWKLAFEENLAGSQLSFIGWPTVDGSCGSDAYLEEPISIVKQGANTDACWEFVKFMLTDVDEDLDYGLPVYMPVLEKMVENAKVSEDNPVQMTDTDAERFFSLLAAIENVAIYDETVLEIIREDSRSLFNGSKTAEEVARVIQSRVSLYVSEQNYDNLGT